MACALQNGYTPLHHASNRGHTSVVHVLLSHNADPSLLSDVRFRMHGVWVVYACHLLAALLLPCCVVVCSSRGSLACTSQHMVAISSLRSCCLTMGLTLTHRIR